MNIKDKIAIISGAATGLGTAMSELLTKKGARVYGLAGNEQQLNALKAKLGELYVPVSLDVTDEAMVQQWVNKIFSDSHIPDILINNAEVAYLSTVDKLTSAKWQEMINTNLNGLFFLSSAIIPLMGQKAASSHIINIGPILEKVKTNKSAGYSAIRFAIQGFSEALAEELRNDGIKVTCINSCSTSTGFLENSGMVPHENMLHPEDIARLIVNVLETPGNMLIKELTLRPLQQRRKFNTEPQLNSPVCYANSDEVREEFREDLLSGEMKKTLKTPNDKG